MGSLESLPCWDELIPSRKGLEKYGITLAGLVSVFCSSEDELVNTGSQSPEDEHMIPGSESPQDEHVSRGSESPEELTLFEVSTYFGDLTW